jgi:hypothetical protein
MGNVGLKGSSTVIFDLSTHACRIALAFLQENVSDETRRQPSFIRILSGAVLRRGAKLLIASADGKLDAAGETELKDALTKVCPLLLPFVEDKTELQTEILLEAQKLSEETGHKDGAAMMQWLMVALYNEDACEYDAFMAWKEGISLVVKHRRGITACVCPCDAFVVTPAVLRRTKLAR